MSSVFKKPSGKTLGGPTTGDWLDVLGMRRKSRRSDMVLMGDFMGPL